MEKKESLNCKKRETELEKKISPVRQNRSSVLFIFPGHKIIMLTLYLIEKTVVNPVRWLNTQMRGLNLGPVRYVLRLTVWIRPPPHRITVVQYGEKRPLPLPYVTMVGLVKHLASQ
jgi:hypothetical protein